MPFQELFILNLNLTDYLMRCVTFQTRHKQVRNANTYISKLDKQIRMSFENNHGERNEQKKYLYRFCLLNSERIWMPN